MTPSPPRRRSFPCRAFPSCRPSSPCHTARRRRRSRARARRAAASVLVLVASACGGGGGGGGDVTVTEAPAGGAGGVVGWRANMTAYGRRHCELLADGGASFDQRLAATYYDAQWVYFRIGDAAGDPAWYECAERAASVYRDGYVLPNGGKVPGYWNFPNGLAEDVKRTGSGRSREALSLLGSNAAYSGASGDVGPGGAAALSREIAYALDTALELAAAGEPEDPSVPRHVELSLAALDAWGSGRERLVRPFLVALTAEALIRYDERRGDARIVPALRGAADRMWDTLWVPEARAFRYASEPDGGPEGTEPAVDLNLLIAPLYAYLYARTGDPAQAARADEIFDAGVRGAYLESPKVFNQNYRWSFDYIRWRGG